MRSCILCVCVCVLYTHTYVTAKYINLCVCVSYFFQVILLFLLHCISFGEYEEKQGYANRLKIFLITNN